MVLGVLWLARTARVRWEPVSLLAGALIAVTGFVLPAGGVFMLGVLVLIVTLLKGISAQQRGRDPARLIAPGPGPEPAPRERYCAWAEPARCSMAWAYSRPAR